MKAFKLFLLLAFLLPACATKRVVNEEKFRFSAWNGDAVRLESFEQEAKNLSRRTGGEDRADDVAACPVYYSKATREHEGWSTYGRNNVLYEYVLAMALELCPEYFQSPPQ